MIALPIAYDYGCIHVGWHVIQLHSAMITVTVIAAGIQLSY